MALGFGFRCGFLGLLHLEIVQERLRREYGMDIIATYPERHLPRHADRRHGQRRSTIRRSCPKPTYIEKIEEPMVKAFVICPNEYIGDMMALISEKRGAVDHTETLDSRRVMLTSLLPLNEILIDFHDRIKSITRGYGSMDYEHAGYHGIATWSSSTCSSTASPWTRFRASCTATRRRAGDARWRRSSRKSSRASNTRWPSRPPSAGKSSPAKRSSALRKDVTAKCYGGDITRKRKLLEKQKEGKKRMKSFGSVNIPQEAFIEVLKA